MTFGYIGPGPGFAVQAPLLGLAVGIVIAALTLLTFPLRMLLRRPRARRRGGPPRVVMLGLDGLEPTLTERWMAEGHLPNLRRLSYQRLATTCPPLSPVAWSSFATGVNPGKHGIFGFLHRHRDFRPYLAFSQVDEVPAHLGPLRLPWKVGRPRQLRKSQSFWKILGEHGVFSHVIRVPVTWPAESFHGTMLSAMGVPDLRGSQGTYTLFGREPESLREGEFVPLAEDGSGRLEIGGLGELRLRLTTAGELSWDGRKHQLHLGKPTPWLPVRLGKSRGIARFLWLRAEPARLYMTPIQIDPEQPAMPISWPPYYSVALSKLLGPYATCGLAEDTGGREDEVLSQADFLEQAYDIHEERCRQLFHCLERGRQGLCLAVFDGTDRIQHMAMGDEAVLLDLYRRMDELVGKVHSRLAESDVLVVMSDHGFKPLTRMVDINAWLLENGYLHLKADHSVDWSRTRAYGLGLAGLHLNVRGRDAEGCVEPGQIQALKSELIAALEGLTDGDQRPISRVFEAARVYTGPYLERAPDLVIGYNVGYRVSKASGRGEVGSVVLEDNRSNWCGDHCLDPELVPGVLFCSQPLTGSADIRDLAPTVLDWFGVPLPDHLEGKSLRRGFAPVSRTEGGCSPPA